MKPTACRPESLILTHHLVPPVCIRPVVAMDSAGMTNQDDVTVRLFNIIHVNENMKDCVAKGREVKAMMEGWEYLQLLSALLINSELPSLQSQAISLGSKAGRGLCQRLKGKTGRIRGNLSGKRVDFTSRTVISPDPNLEIDQVAVPIEAAMKLTYPEVVTTHNIERLRAAVLRGANAHPGANYVEKAGSGRKQWLKFARDLSQLSRSLEVPLSLSLSLSLSLNARTPSHSIIHTPFPSFLS
jgi:DNA-directed RNA polymerase III subunit RPC1